MWLVDPGPRARPRPPSGRAKDKASRRKKKKRKVLDSDEEDDESESDEEDDEGSEEEDLVQPQLSIEFRCSDGTLSCALVFSLQSLCLLPSASQASRSIISSTLPLRPMHLSAGRCITPHPPSPPPLSPSLPDKSSPGWNRSRPGRAGAWGRRTKRSWPGPSRLKA